MQIQRALLVEAVEQPADAAGQYVLSGRELRQSPRARGRVRRQVDRCARGGRERSRARRPQARLRPVLLRARRLGPALRLRSRHATLYLGVYKCFTLYTQYNCTVLCFSLFSESK